MRVIAGDARGTKLETLPGEEVTRPTIDRVKEAVERGWTKEEAIRGISFADRYPMSPGTEDLMQKVQKNNVSYLYDLLKPERGNSPSVPSF